MNNKGIKMIFQKLVSLVIGISILLLSACNEKQDENVVLEKITDSNNEAEMVSVTAEQFNTSGMKLGKIVEKTFADRIQTTGMMDVPPEYKATVSFYFGGTVKDIHLLVGQSVKAGQTLFTLVNPEFVQVQQDFLSAKSSMRYLKAEYERQKKLLSENVSSKKKYLKTEMEFFTIRSKYEALGKKLKLLNIDPASLSFNTISSSVRVKAPINGYITEVNITKGESLSKNDVAVEIINTEHMHLELNVFEKDINKIKKGATIFFTLPDNKSKKYEAEVFLVGKTVSSNDRIINVHGHIKDESAVSNFIPGMFINAEILTDKINGFALPSSAIVDVEDDSFVLVLNTSDQSRYSFTKQKVKVGKTTNGFHQILNPEDFSNEDQFVIKGAFNLIQ